MVAFVEQVNIHLYYDLKDDFVILLLDEKNQLKPVGGELEIFCQPFVERNCLNKYFEYIKKNF